MQRHAAPPEECVDVVVAFHARVLREGKIFGELSEAQGNLENVERNCENLDGSHELAEGTQLCLVYLLGEAAECAQEMANEADVQRESDLLSVTRASDLLVGCLDAGSDWKQERARIIIFDLPRQLNVWASRIEPAHEQREMHDRDTVRVYDGCHGVYLILLDLEDDWFPGSGRLLCLSLEGSRVFG